MKLVVLITARTEQGLEVAQAWQETGAPGVTIIRAHGLFSLQETVRKGTVELPRMLVSMAAALAHIIESTEGTSELILSLVEKEKVDPLVKATESVLGDLSQPGHGVLFVLNVERALGVRDHRPTSF